MGKVDEGADPQSYVSPSGLGHRAAQIQGQKIFGYEHGERREWISGLGHLYGGDKSVLQYSQGIADEQTSLRHGPCLWGFAEFCKDLIPLLTICASVAIVAGYVPTRPKARVQVFALHFSFSHS